MTLVEAIARRMAESERTAPPISANGSAGKKGTRSSSSAGDTVDVLAAGIQVGKTKVFLRRRAFDVLEKIRKDFMAAASIKVQAIARGYIDRRNYEDLCEADL